jgi:uncharacterized membrane-anchored protein
LAQPLRENASGVTVPIEDKIVQLRLQVTVEGLSMAAISYYVVSLLLYAFKGLQAYGLPFNPEMAVALLLPLVLWSVWRSRQKIHAKLHRTDA